MYIKRILIVNYKSCQRLHVDLSKDDPNILIGINDCGKSTILSAIGLLLDERPLFNYVKDDKKKNDVSNTKVSYDDYIELLTENDIPIFDGYSNSEGELPNKCLIIGEFQIEQNDIPDELIGNLSSHLQWVLETNEENALWICREFDGDSAKHTDYLLTFDKAKDPLRLFYEKSTKLNKIRQNEGVSNEDIENENNKGRFKNTELIRAIYSKHALTLNWSQYEKKSDKWLFPEYRYLDWNISMDQLNQFTKDIIDNKINEEISKAKVYASEKSNEAQQIVNRELQEFTNQFATDLTNIEGFIANINFNVTSKVTDLFVQKTNSDGPVHLDNQGEGVKRQIWFALI